MVNDSKQIFAQFKPRDYLNYYYNRIDDENQSLLEFFANSYRYLKPNSKMLEFGGGPTIYQIISAARYASEIDFCDYLQLNLDEIKAWKNGQPGAFSWDLFIKRALTIEGQPSNEAAVKQRGELVKSKLSKIMLADAFKNNPCGPKRHGQYDALGVIFVPEGITSSKSTWLTTLKNITSLLKPRGTLVMGAITEAEYWKSGSQVLPAVYLTNKDFKRTFPELGLSIQSFQSIPSEVLDPKNHEYTGYKGMAFIRAVKA